MGTKISEMIEAEKIQDEDIIPIVQNNVNKKIKMKKLRTETHTTLTTTTPIAENTNYTIPVNYKVGSNTLDIYYMGEKLVKDEHYIEVGESGAVSNIIQFKDWGTISAKG